MHNIPDLAATERIHEDCIRRVAHLISMLDAVRRQGDEYATAEHYRQMQAQIGAAMRCMADYL